MNTLTMTPHSVGDATVDTVDARQLHAFLEVAKDFSDWLRAQVERARLQRGRDFIELPPQPGVNPPVGRPRIDFALTIDAAMRIAQLAGTERGTEVREHLLEREAQATRLKPASRSPFFDPRQPHSTASPSPSPSTTTSRQQVHLRRAKQPEGDA